MSRSLLRAVDSIKDALGVMKEDDVPILALSEPLGERKTSPSLDRCQVR